VVGATKVKAGATVCSVGSITPPFLCLASGASGGVEPLGDPLYDLPEPPGLPTSFPSETKASDKKIDLTCPMKDHPEVAPGVCVFGKLKAENGGEIHLHGPAIFVVNGIEVKGRKNDSKPSVITMSNSGSNPAGVMLFNVGKITVNDGGELHLKAMSRSEAISIQPSTKYYEQYAQIALFQARCRAKDLNSEKCDSVNAKGQKILLKSKKKNSGQTATFTFGGALYAPNSKLEIKGFAEDEDPPALEDIDPLNDPTEVDDPNDLDIEATYDFDQSTVIVGELVVGKNGKLVINTEWPYAAGYLIPTSSLIE
jgi:hypothetical protein